DVCSSDLWPSPIYLVETSSFEKHRSTRDTYSVRWLCSPLRSYAACPGGPTRSCTRGRRSALLPTEYRPQLHARVSLRRARCCLRPELHEQPAVEGQLGEGRIGREQVDECEQGVVEPDVHDRKPQDREDGDGPEERVGTGHGHPTPLRGHGVEHVQSRDRQQVDQRRTQVGKAQE